MEQAPTHQQLEQHMQPQVPTQQQPPPATHQVQQQQQQQQQQPPPPAQPRLPRELVPIAPMPSSADAALSPVITNYVQEQLSMHRATLKRDIDEFRQEMMAEINKRQKIAEGRGQSRKSAAAASSLAQHHMNAALAGIPNIGEALGAKGDGGGGSLMPQSSRSGASLLMEGGSGDGMDEALAGGGLDSSSHGSTAGGGGGSVAEKADKHKDVPSYELSLEVKSVRDLYVEWMDGWKGGPAVKELNEKYETRWRKTDKARQRWCRREAVYRELVKRAREAFERRTKRPAAIINNNNTAELQRADYDEAVTELDAIMTRMSYSLNKLAEWLKRPVRSSILSQQLPQQQQQQQPPSVLPLPAMPPHNQQLSHGGLPSTHDASQQPQMLAPSSDVLGGLPSSSDAPTLAPPPPSDTPLLHPPSPMEAPTADQGGGAPTMSSSSSTHDQLANPTGVLPPLHHDHHHHHHHHHLQVPAES